MKIRLKIFLILLIVSVLFIFSLQAKSKATSDYESIETLMQVITLLKEHHIYEPSVDTLVENALQGILDKLDLHTTYLKVSDFENFSSQTEGH